MYLSIAIESVCKQKCKLYFLYDENSVKYEKRNRTDDLYQ